MSEPGSFFDTDIWKEASQNLCADGWPHVVVFVNQEVRKIREQNTKLQAALDVAMIQLKYDLRLLESYGMDTYTIEEVFSKIEELLK